MKTAGTILGAAVLLLASGTTATADIVAGPLPVVVLGVNATGSITCSVFNNTFTNNVGVDIGITDALGNNVKLDFCTLNSQQSCSTSAVLTDPKFSANPKQSPFTCRIEANLRGSICGAVDNPQTGLPGSPYCLPAQ